MDRNFPVAARSSAAIAIFIALIAPAQQTMPSGMAHMPGHMYMTTLRPPRPGDQEKADAVHGLQEGPHRRLRNLSSPVAATAISLHPA
jgi:hypothetical protein